MRLAELAHVEEMQVVAVAIKLLAEDLCEMRLADAGWPCEAEHRQRLVTPARRKAAAQLCGNGIHGVVLTNYARFYAPGQIVCVNSGDALAFRIVRFLERGAVRQAIKYIHDDPRKVAALEQIDRQSGDGGARDKQARK